MISTEKLVIPWRQRKDLHPKPDLGSTWLCWRAGEGSRRHHFSRMRGSRVTEISIFLKRAQS